MSTPTFIDKRKNPAGLAPAPAAAPTPGPTVQTSTLPPNPTPGQAPGWANPGGPVGARPPARPHGLAPPAPAPRPHPLDRLRPEARALIEGYGDLTPNVWTETSPPGDDRSLLDAICWALGQPEVPLEEARSWFADMPFDAWTACTELYMLAGGSNAHWTPAPAPAAYNGQDMVGEPGPHEATVAEAPREIAPMPPPSAAKQKAAAKAAAQAEAASEPDEDDEDEGTDEEVVAAHEGSPVVAASGPPVAQTPPDKRRMSKAIKEQARKLIEGGASDAEISTVLAFPEARIAEYRKGLSTGLAGMEGEAPPPAPKPVQLAPPHDPAPVADMPRHYAPGEIKVDVREVVLFFELAARVMPVSATPPTVEELDTMCDHIERQVRAWRTLRSLG